MNPDPGDRLESAPRTRVAARRRHAGPWGRDELLAHLGHELRTPLGTILGQIDVLAAAGDARLRQPLDIVRRNATHMLAVLEDLLRLARLESGEPEAERAPTDVRALLADVESSCAPEARRRGLSLRCSADAGVPAALATDATKLRQVLTNLVTNAIKFTDRGSVLVRARFVDSSGGRVELTVRDTGAGMDDAQRRRVFDPFTQFHAERSGSGLGLAITRRLVDLLDGTLRLDSEPGRGTTFTVRIPTPLADDAVVPRDAGDSA